MKPDCGLIGGQQVAIPLDQPRTHQLNHAASRIFGEGKDLPNRLTAFHKDDCLSFFDSLKVISQTIPELTKAQADHAHVALLLVGILVTHDSPIYISGLLCSPEQKANSKVYRAIRPRRRPWRTASARLAA